MAAAASTGQEEKKKNKTTLLQQADSASLATSLGKHLHQGTLREPTERESLRKRHVLFE